jgi:hypothetical protein
MEIKPMHEQEIKKLVENSAAATKSEDALRFSQAALNLAHVVATIVNLPNKEDAR